MALADRRANRPWLRSGRSLSISLSITVASVAMSTAGIVHQSSRLLDDRRIERRQIALHIDDDLHLPRRIEGLQGFKNAIRARGVIRRASSPPCRHGIGPPSSNLGLLSVATTGSPRPASRARSTTCTIIGFSPIIANGLPGSRVEAIRAGINTRDRGDVSLMGAGLWTRSCHLSPADRANGRKTPLSSL
jgi:hypothetical protein